MSETLKIAAVLRRARTLLEKPEHWGTGLYYDQGRYCLVGALNVSSARAPDYDGTAAQRFIEQRVLKQGTIAWNDRETRTHAQALRLMDRAIKKAEAEAEATHV